MASILAARKSSGMNPLVVAVIGIIVLIAGIAVATIRGTGLRGSGLGTILIVVGVVLLLVGAFRYRGGSTPSQRTQTQASRESH